MESKSTLNSVYIFFGPILLAVVGWFMATTLQEIKQDVKTLLETNATLKEKVHQLELKVENIDKTTSLRKPLTFSLVYDKTKRLTLTSHGFQYV